MREKLSKMYKTVRPIIQYLRGMGWMYFDKLSKTKCSKNCNRLTILALKESS